MPFLDPYRRITSSGKLIPEIDGLRFVAIFSVFIFHLTGDVLRHSSASNLAMLKSSPLFKTTQVLNIGVQLFFLISGFVLGMPFAASYRQGKGMIPLSKYFQRRLTRLEIPYILTLLIFFVLKVASAKGTVTELLPHLAASMFYVHNLLFKAPSAINFVAWSLEVEVQFYLIAPVFALVYALRSSVARQVVLVSAVLLFTAFSTQWPDQPLTGLSLFGHCQYFIAGFLAADIYSLSKARNKTALWDVVLCIALPLNLSLLISGKPTAAWLEPWLLLILTVAGFNSLIFNRILIASWISTVGGMCYSIYLLHNYVIASLGTSRNASSTTQHFLNAFPSSAY